MSSLDQDFHRRLEKKLAEAEDNKLSAIRAGNLNEGQYKSETGFLRAIEHVRTWCREIEDNINQGK